MSGGTPRPGWSRRHLVLAAASLATLAASIWAIDSDDALDLDRSRPPTHLLPTAARVSAGKSVAQAASEPDAALALPDRSADWQVRRNLFEGQGAVAASRPALPASAPVAAVAVATAAAASAPPPPPPLTLPFSYAGRLVTAAGPSVLLNDGAVTRVLALGNTLGEFRFEQDSGQQLDFVHVPSGERVVLALQP